ncbi:metal ABC transporter solute-binding protein, Zn/Mn family [Bacillus marinisedimentorum]|uniref:metal ABC transporter solute-binding protein, Zn/Mn family n=1 Tax=Bacillus marinisedimentorum TaxID=1821260 RepID=UPI000AD500AE|nr:zinc ABC transporter substrate-binding protein [Bacillus marinisedimentorum]
MKRIMKVAIIFSLVPILFLAGCAGGNKEDMPKDGELSIYTSLFPVEDFTEKIGGEHVKVTNIMPLGGDAHTFEPTQKTIVKVAEADAFIYNGVGMEPYADKMESALEKENVKFYEASAGIESGEHDEKEENHEGEEGNEDDEHAHGDVNPHIWLDPVLAVTMAENIKNALQELKPEAEDDFEENFKVLKSDLEKINAEFEAAAGKTSTKKFMVSHAAYEYWEDRYGLEQLAITGLSPSQEPTQAELEKLIKQAREYNIDTILFEQNVTPKVADIIKEEIGADVLYLHNLAVLTEEDVENDEDYFSLMRKNIKSMEKALD